MAIKTFTTGEVLTASDTNTYLANSGLVCIGSVTATNTVIALDNCFSSTYDNYHIVYTQTNVTTTGTSRLRFRAGGSPIITNYYYSGRVFYYNAVSTDNYSAADSAFPILIGSGAIATQAQIDITNPRIAQEKSMQSMANSRFTNYIGFTNMGTCTNTATNYDGIQVYQDSGGTLTGTLTVYGWRKV